MNTDLPALVSSGAAPDARVGPASRKHPADTSTKKFAPMSADEAPAANAAEKTTTDNNLPVAHDEAVNPEIRAVPGAFPGKTPTEAAHQTREGTELEETTNAAAIRPVLPLNLLAQSAQVVDDGKQPAATKKGVVEAKTVHKLAEIAGDLKGSKLARVYYGDASTRVSAYGSKQLLAAHNQVGKSKSSDGIVSDKTAVSAKDITDAANTKQLGAEILTGSNKVLAHGDDAAIVSKRAISYSSSSGSKQSMPQAAGNQLGKSESSATAAIVSKRPISDGSLSSSKESMPQAAGNQLSKSESSGKAPISDRTEVVTKDLTSEVTAKESATKSPTDGNKVSADGQRAAVTGKPVISGGDETPTNTSVHAVQDKSPDLQSQFAAAAAKESASIVGKSAVSKADVGHGQTHRAPGSTELVDAEGKEYGSGGNNPSGESILKDLNGTNVQISANQTKHRSSLSSDSDNSDQGSKPVFSVAAAQPPITQRTSASTSAGTGGNHAPPGDASTSVGEQTQEAIHSLLSRGNQQITIRLNPPELGRVSIKFQEQDGQIIGSLEVSKAQTRAEIQQALPQIIQNLADHGVQIKRLEVLLTDQHQQQPSKGQSSAAGQDGWSGQQSPANTGSDADGPSGIAANQWLTNADSYSHFAEPLLQITNESINILV